jgi:hypothetical protein
LKPNDEFSPFSNGFEFWLACEEYAGPMHIRAIATGSTDSEALDG